MATTTRFEYTSKGKTISYLEAGPKDGPLIIFIHGWPAIAETWKPQIDAFSGLGFRVVAPDMPGYGKSTITKEKRDYSLEVLVGQLVGLLAHLERSEAIWVGHDWGAIVVWSLLAHAPEACAAVVNMCVPYRTFDLGIEELLKTVNRDIYPKDSYPNGQWDYVLYYQGEETFAKATEYFDRNVTTLTKLVYVKGDPNAVGKPAFTSDIFKNGGWFGGVDPPSVPLEVTVLDADLYDKVHTALKEGGFWSANAYYTNPDVNRKYTEDWSKNEGIVSLPTLYIDATYDAICTTSVSEWAGEMRNYCRKHTEVNIDAGHWVAMEKPEEVNAAILRWLATSVPDAWPYAKKSPLLKDW